MSERKWATIAVAELGVALAFLLLAAVATWPLARDLHGTTLAGTDPAMEMFAVDWTTKHLFRDSFFHANVFHPSPYSILYADLALGSGILVWPLRLVFDDPVPLFNLATLFALAFSGWAFHKLVHERTGDRLAGALAGLIATFDSHQTLHLPHLNLISTGWIALFLLAITRLAERPRARDAVLAAVSFSLTAQSSGYYAVILAIVAVLFGAARWRRFGDRRFVAHATAAAGLAVVLTGPYLRAFSALAGQIGMRRTTAEAVEYSFHPLRDLTSTGHLWGSLLGSGGEAAFPGLLPPILAVFALSRRAADARLWAGLTATLLALSLGPRVSLPGVDLPGPYLLLAFLPGFDAMRHPCSFGAVALMLLATLAGLGAAALRRGGGRRATVLGGGLLSLAAVEAWAPPPKVRDVPRGLAPVYAELVRRPRAPVLEVAPMNPDLLLWAARTGYPFVSGLAAWGPPYNLALQRQIKNHWRSGAPAPIDSSRPTQLLREKFPDTRYVVVRAGAFPALDQLAAAMSRSRTFVELFVAEDGDRLYEVRHPRGE
ncbi:MAG: hypothetical protein NDJ94_07595 [Vicinamibacteria bacterium]|nr:hypothetical protein [Vicinamibacteria bacterium]